MYIIGLCRLYSLERALRPRIYEDIRREPWWFENATTCEMNSPGVQLDEPYRRFSDGCRPTSSPSGRPGVPAATTQSAPPAPGRRTQSDSATFLEQQLGQELRRISDEFQLSYQGPRGRSIPARISDTSPSPAHASSLPEARRRGSLVERFLGLFSSTDEICANNDVFTPRRRAHSEIFMASGVTADMFGRQESLLSAGSAGSSEPEQEVGPRLTSRHDDCTAFDEVDNGNYSDINDNDEDDHQVMFHLSTDEQ